MPQTLDAVVLLGWLDEDVAVRLLCESCVFSRGLARSAAMDLWRGYRDRTAQAVGGRPAPRPVALPVEDEGTRAFLGVAAWPAVGVVAVDPALLLALQFFVITERSASYAAASGSWAERCLVTERPRCKLPIAVEGNSLIFDVPHWEHALVATPQGELRVDQTPPYTMVAKVGDGLVLRAGYHRAYAYLRSRPAEPFLAAMTEWELTEIPDPRLRAKVAGEHPPLFGDFLNPALAMPVRMIRRRYRFKVTAEMAFLPVE